MGLYFKYIKPLIQYYVCTFPFQLFCCINTAAHNSMLKYRIIDNGNEHAQMVRQWLFFFLFEPIPRVTMIHEKSHISFSIFEVNRRLKTCWSHDVIPIIHSNRPCIQTQSAYMSVQDGAFLSLFQGVCACACVSSTVLFSMALAQLVALTIC